MTSHDDLVLVRTPRLRIRRKCIDDALDDYRWRRDPETVRFDGAAPLDQPYSDFLQQFRSDLMVANPARQLFSLDMVDGPHIGNVMYYNADSVRGVAEVGLSIGEHAYRGQGLGSEAMTAFVFYLWHSHPFHTLFLHTLEWNHRAQRCFARAGFSAIARVQRAEHLYLRMEARREWWLMHFEAGRIPAEAKDA
jgi:RimJ/RimL family protein N-acetyltransferase